MFHFAFVNGRIKISETSEMRLSYTLCHLSETGLAITAINRTEEGYQLNDNIYVVNGCSVYTQMEEMKVLKSKQNGKSQNVQYVVG
jgi:hypothetical protein